MWMDAFRSHSLPSAPVGNHGPQANGISLTKPFKMFPMCQEWCYTPTILEEEMAK